MSNVILDSVHKILVSGDVLRLSLNDVHIMKCSKYVVFRCNVRTLNRRKYRGYCGIHNPDGRKLTGRRRFLGAAGGPSYSRTVWVVRKPKVCTCCVVKHQSSKTFSFNIGYYTTNLYRIVHK